MFKRTKISAGALMALGVIAAMPAMSQGSAQRVEITGSNIRRAEAETASPVQVITKQEIDQSGKGTVAEYLQTLTADGQGSVPFTYGRGFSGATASGISLRGLGANATLVLVNGRRVTSAVLADDAQRSFTDLNAIPLEAVERVEVLKDGASSIYGSDAVAGVVNIILKKSYVGTVAKVSYGLSQKHDGGEPRAAITHGFGDMAADGYNVLLNFEVGKKDEILYKDRAGRGTVGISAIGNSAFGFGFDPNSNSNNLTGANKIGGNGWIPVDAGGVRLNNQGGASIIGSVRNPTTLDYYSRGDAAGVGFTRAFPAAQTFCNANANLAQTNPAGGCLTDQWQKVGQVQPDQKTYNLFSRLSKQINANTEGFVELGYYHTESRVVTVGLSPSSAYFTPLGAVSQTAITQLGAAHPDNPYFGTAARLSYNATPEIGPTVTDSSSNTWRAVAGMKGTWGVWDFDTALAFSESKQTDTLEKRINWRVKNALLNPIQANVDAAKAISPAYAALPAGTYWRIGENAGLNSAATYAALLQDESRSGFSRQYGVDFKVSRELGKLEGGPIGLAVGAEARHEANELPFYDGLGDYIGLSLTKYGAARNIWATYVEGLFPVLKVLELNAALRYDHYSDAGDSVTPKIGVKFRALPTLTLRGTYAEGFRAPSSAENSLSSVAAFGGATVNDKARCAGTGVNATLCNGVTPTFLQRGNPDLKPEKSKSATLGLVWDVTPKTSLTADLWEIKRTGLPVIEDTQAAVDAGRVTRDPATATTALDPGAILTGFVQFVNSASSVTRGLDIEAKHRWDLGGGMGRLIAGMTWTHLITQRVIDADGTIHDYAGTHGNCEITNCIGSPKDKVQVSTTWDMNRWRAGLNLNYRGSFDGTDEKNAPCWSAAVAGGKLIPADCKVASFYTLDLSGAWKLGANTEVFGSIQNLTDKKPPFDPETYGALGYNPLDYSGAIGRFFRIGLKHKF